MKKLTLSLLASLAAASLSQQASALTLSVGDTYYLGEIVNGAPADDPAQAQYINYLRTLSAGATDIQIPIPGGEVYDRVNSTVAGPFPNAVTTNKHARETDNVLNLANTYAYVYVKYGGKALVWYSATGFSGDVTVPANAGTGLSHADAYNKTGPTTPVADGGMSLALLGLGLFGVAAAARRNA